METDVEDVIDEIKNGVIRGPPAIPAGIKIGRQKPTANDIKPAPPETSLMELPNLPPPENLAQLDLPTVESDSEIPRNGFHPTIEQLPRSIVTEPKPEPKPKSEPELKPKPKPEPESKSEPELEPESKPKLEPEPKPKSEPESKQISESGLTDSEEDWLESASLDMQITHFKTKHPEFEIITLRDAASLAMKRAFVTEINRLFRASLKSDIASPEPIKEITESGLPEDEQAWLDGAELSMKIAQARSDYPELAIPKLPDHASLAMKQTLYKNALKYIHIGNKTGDYKFWLSVSIVVMEWVVYKFMGVDIRGFFKMQSKRMHRYESALWEIAERSANGTGVPWPPEIRIIFIILTNAVVFILIKVLSTWVGEGLGETLGNSLLSVLDRQQDASAAQEQDADGDIPDVPSKRNMDGLSGLISTISSMFMGGDSKTTNNSQKKTKRRTRRNRTRPSHRN
uniref:Uncharacterized protein n=1 Tax=Pithovirus LCPAC103 TaxID=2506588 RepID=A0A481Z4N3_9VIRU|nr:MAG: uncharacterized protein LCPAC103_00630 [Pithovirus LCPAC103]